jgi:hypothetical protein
MACCLPPFELLLTISVPSQSPDAASAGRRCTLLFMYIDGTSFFIAWRIEAAVSAARQELLKLFSEVVLIYKMIGGVITFANSCKGYVHPQSS